MKILIVGGAGYIGSHMVQALARAGATCVTLDNLSTGHADAVRHGELVVGDTGDAMLVDDLLARHRFDAVMHFAASSLVAASMREPALYYRNNVAHTLQLLDSMRRHGVQRFVFSSSAAVYGEPQQDLIAETHPRNPINTYGRTKHIVENVLADYDRAYGLHSVALRYFNAAGADPQGELGERHDPETHLIPLVLQAAAGRRPHIELYGTDYATPDGTCIRDYVHVSDLCDAHLLALRHLMDGGDTLACNLGNGAGFSVREVIHTAQAVTGRTIQVIERPRRPGDPARLVADAALARRLLHWQARIPALADIVRHAWAWEQKLGPVPFS